MTALFCSIEFLSAICVAGVAGNVLADILESKHRHSPSKSSFIKTESVVVENTFDDYIKFLSRNLSILNQFPFHIYQLAMNEPSGSAVEEDSLKLQLTANTFQWITKSNTPSTCFFKLDDFSQEILCIASSCDGEHIALGGQDALVHVLDSVTGKLVRTCTGHAQAVCCLCFVGSNKLCSGSYDGTLSLWDIRKGFRITVLTGHKKRVSACCSDAMGHIVVSVSWDSTLRVWSAIDGREITCISKNKCPLTSVSFHPTKQLVVTGGWDKTVKMWDLESMERKAVLRGHLSSVQSVAFSSNGLCIASGDLHGKIITWSSVSGAAVSRFSGHFRSISCLSFLPSGNAFISGSHDGMLKIWGNHWKTPIRRWNLSTTVTVIQFLSLHHLAVGSEDGNVFVFKINKGSEHWTDGSLIGEPITCLGTCVSYSNAPSVLIGTKSGSLRISVLKQDGKNLGKMGNPVTVARYGFDIVVAGDSRGYIAVFKPTLPDNECRLDCTQGHQGKITCCSLVSSEIFLTMGIDKVIRIWKLDHSAIISEEIIYSGHSDWITTAAYEDGLLVTGSQDAGIKLWNSDSRISEVQMDMDGPVAFLTIKGDYIFGGGENGSVGVWTKRGKSVSFQAAPPGIPKQTLGYLFEIENETTSNKNVIYSGYLANVEENGDLVIRKPFSHSQIMCLEGHRGPVTSSAILQNGNVVSSSLDGSVRFWSVLAEMENRKRRHREPIVMVGMAQNGKVAFSSDRAGRTIIWMVQDRELGFKASIEVKAEYTVTATTFVHPEGQMILCAEQKEKSMLHVYCVKQSVNYVSGATVVVPSEVIDVHWHQSNNTVLASLKSGQVILTDPKLTKRVTIDGGNNWCLSARMFSPLSILVAVNRTVKAFALPKSFWPSCITSKPTMTYKATLNVSAIINVMEVDEGTKHIYTGDTVGFLTVHTESDQQSIRVHQDCIIGVCFWAKYMFTGSKDGTVKAWLKNEIQQVGLFTFPAAVTSLSVANSETNEGNHTQVLVGMSTGETHLLIWWANQQPK